MWQRIVLLTLFICTITACESIATLNTPPKKAIHSNSKVAQKAQTLFWKTLHEGRYWDISKVDYLLMAAYLENPNDPELAAHLGFIHIWKITERNRYIPNPISPLITNEIILARKYFSDAVELDPKNAIYQGFQGDSQLVEGTIFHDKRQEVHGYFTVKRAIKKWPEFNYFTAGYPMSTLAVDSKQFKEALRWQWRTLDLCAGKKVDRHNPTFSPYMSRETQTGLQRACWNSWKAPHNFEGFFMNMGDMVVKSGDWQTGMKLYENAKLAANYRSWPFRMMLEKRIRNAAANVRNFQQEQVNPDKAMMFSSGYGCVACHQR